MSDLSGIAPFLSELHLLHLDRLEDRSDLVDILKTRFPHVHSIKWMPDYLQDCGAHLKE
jgi:hypothetical protein